MNYENMKKKDLNLSKTFHKMDKNNTKHYSHNANQLTFELMDIIPKNETIIEPFAGGGALVNLLEEKEHKVLAYDIIYNQDVKNLIAQDTLLNPPNYKNKWIVTNPPYLANNKTKDKTIFIKYGVDDLYKASIKTIIQGSVAGGILIIPLNFFTDIKSEKLRKEFLSSYEIKTLNIYKCKMFDATSYNVCSFNFIKRISNNKNINLNIISDKNILEYKGVEILNNRLFQQFYKKINIKTNIKRSLKPVKNGILIHCIDNINVKIRAELCTNFIPKISDRTKCIIDLKCSIAEKKDIIEKFNNFIEKERTEYFNLIFTNYRENNRKRIDFKTVYKIIEGVQNGF